MALSGWFIDDIELPIAPNKDKRKISRQFQAETLNQFFPEISKSTARAFDYTLFGFLYPEGKVFELDELAKSADTNTVVVTIPPDQQIFNTEKFAVKDFEINRQGPLRVFYIDKIINATPYSLTLTQLPDEGENTEGLDGFTDTDEGALGLQQLNELNSLTGGNQNVTEFGPIELFETIFGLPIAL
jgi:hypothetical protein